MEKVNARGGTPSRDIRLLQMSFNMGPNCCYARDSHTDSGCLTRGAAGGGVAAAHLVCVKLPQNVLLVF
jgi:hypothetical protein